MAVPTKDIEGFLKETLTPTTTTVKTLTDVLGDRHVSTRSGGGADAGTAAFLQGTHAQKHGFMGLKTWAPPVLVRACDQEARPGYASCKAHEYNDVPEVLAEKILKVASLIKASHYCTAYTGAGISTSAGIGDYATRASDTLQERPHLKSPYLAQPTLSHHVMAAMHRLGLLKYWIQQNHDGLPQKAGFPQGSLNEIHGAWYDPSNPVVKMAGNLREDLYADMLQWEEQADLCLVLGTSLCGMNADRVATTPASKAKHGKGYGTIIVGLQCTQYDDMASIRIFAKLDTVMEQLAAALAIDTTPFKTAAPIAYVPDVPPAALAADTFVIPYDATGKRSHDVTTTLTLTDYSKVRITSGRFEGNVGEVQGKNREGHYQIRVTTKVKGDFKAPVMMYLGSWWVEAACKGAVALMPIVSHVE